SFWDTIKFVFVVVSNSFLWITVTLITKPTEESVLLSFYKKIRPGGPGWKRITKEKYDIDKDRMGKDWNLPVGLICMSDSSLAILSILFSVGNLIYGNYISFFILLIIAIISVLILLKFWNKIFS
ncbi:MAG: Na+:solute symporter, partial [Bacteroidales bacterium]|nr:Na+:solute symporter [Bacteroidales bacterium]